MVFYIVLGCFLDGISSIVLTMAVVEPMIRKAGIDVIWFGIFLTVLVEMAQITPPVGFNLFVLQGMTKHNMVYLAKAAFPMFMMMVVMIFVLIYFPQLATYLPSTLKGPGSCHSALHSGLPPVCFGFWTLPITSRWSLTALTSAIDSTKINMHWDF